MLQNDRMATPNRRKPGVLVRVMKLRGNGRANLVGPEPPQGIERAQEGRTIPIRSGRANEAGRFHCGPLSLSGTGRSPRGPQPLKLSAR